MSILFAVACLIPILLVGTFFAYIAVCNCKARWALNAARTTGRYLEWSEVMSRLKDRPSTLIFLPGYRKTPDLWWIAADIAGMYEARTGDHIDDNPCLDVAIEFVEWINDLIHSKSSAVDVFLTSSTFRGTVEEFRIYVSEASTGRTRVIDASLQPR